MSSGAYGARSLSLRAQWRSTRRQSEAPPHQHTAAALKDHLESRLGEFGLSYDKDIASVATDSGANVRRCCLDLSIEKNIDWVPCILHGLLNSSKYALGLVDEDIADDADDEPVVRDMLGDAADGL